MKTNLILSILFVMAFCSCKMGHYYANKRITHPDIYVNNQHTDACESINEDNTKTASESLVKDTVPEVEKETCAAMPAVVKKHRSRPAEPIKHLGQVHSKKLFSKKPTVIQRKNIRMLQPKTFTATKSMKGGDGWLDAVIIVAIIAGIIAAIVSQSAGIGFLVALGIIGLVFLGVAIGIALVIWCIFGLIDAILE